MSARARVRSASRLRVCVMLQSRELAVEHLAVVGPQQQRCRSPTSAEPVTPPIDLDGDHALAREALPFDGTRRTPSPEQRHERAQADQAQEAAEIMQMLGDGGGGFGGFGGLVVAEPPSNSGCFTSSSRKRAREDDRHLVGAHANRVPALAPVFHGRPPAAMPPSGSSSAPKVCPVCQAGATSQPLEQQGRQRKRRTMARKRSSLRLGRWWKKYGYCGPLCGCSSLPLPLQNLKQVCVQTASAAPKSSAITVCAGCPTPPDAQKSRRAWTARRSWPASRMG